MPTPVKTLFPKKTLRLTKMYIEHLLKQNSTYHQNLFAQNRINPKTKIDWETRKPFFSKPQHKIID